METERDERIRKRAHEIWEQEGQPHGKEQEHWERAERELSASDLPPLADAAVKKKTPSTRTGAAKTISDKPAATKAGTAKKAPARKI